MTRSTALTAALVAGLILGLLACGKKMPPRPPWDVAPRAVRELSYRLTDKAIILSWKTPLKRRDGSPLLRVSEFRILKAGYEFAEDCPGCPVRYTDAFKLTVSKVAGEDWIEYADSNVSYGYKYIYSVQAVDDDGRVGEEASPVTIYRDVAPGSPPGLEAEGLAEGVALSWEAPEELLDGSAVDEPLYYHLYRREAEGPYVRLAEAGLLTGTAFVDTSVIQDRLYAYKVRAVRSVRGTLIEGPASDEVESLVADVTPPSPPSGLSPRATAEGVLLKWVDNPEPDLAGYRVYRRKEGEKDWRCLTPTLEIVPGYTDRSARKGEVYYYTVTAVDSSARHNESPKSLEAKILVE